uniref:Uncharacterized protein n=1 Tax=Timema poppense TaxID=170557 RepID=A0A7R9CSU9_TIMPO|nr:unnamed protein product [Timema poppensis]
MALDTHAKLNSSICDEEVGQTPQSLLWVSNKDITLVLDAMNNDLHCKKMHLAHKLENVACTLEGEETSTC